MENTEDRREEAEQDRREEAEQESPLLNKPIVMLGDGHPTNLRGKPREAFQPGRFVHPHDAIFLQDGSILVAEWVPIGRVTRLVKEDA